MCVCGMCVCKFVYFYVDVYLCVEGNDGILVEVSPKFSEMIMVAGGPQQ